MPLLMSSYLSERNQCAKIGPDISDFKHVPCGVLHGSILGPLLFLIYINIVNSNSKAAFYLFADDTALFHTNKFIK